MLVGFMGAPCSGKTTTAAMSFADLKDMGIAAEFITEKARTYIAYMRVSCMEEGRSFSLNDEDQLAIAKSQAASEEIMTKASGNFDVVITDSCVCNSLLYMSDEFAAKPEVKSLMLKALKRYDIVFVCGVVPPPVVSDPNRVHTIQQSYDLDEKLKALLVEYVCQLDRGPRFYWLTGDTKPRCREVISEILQLQADPR